MKYTALDTETYRGKAFLLSHAEGVIELNSFADFLNACRKLGKRFVFYNLEYDISAILKFLPETLTKRLYLEKSVTYKGCTFRYLVGKYFKIKWGKECFHFYDIYPFYQTSLDYAARKFLGCRKIKVNRKLIANLSPAKYKRHKAEIDKYAIRDAKLTQQLCDIITNALDECGIETQHLYSPGYIAKRYLKLQRVKVHEIGKAFRDFIRPAFHGARIEVTRRGKIPQANIYDIKSAYPSVIRELPNFSNAEYRLSKRIISKWYFVKCRIWMYEAESYLLPYEQKLDFGQKLTVFPRYQGQSVTITSVEFQYLKKHKLARIEIEQVLNIFVRDRKPFRKLIDKMFKMRAASAGKNILMKLILNSLYGIFAERIREYKSVGMVRGYYQAMRNLEGGYRELFVHRLAQKCPHARNYWMMKCACKYCKFLRRRMRFRSYDDKPLFQYKSNWYFKREKPGRFRNIALASFITATTRVKIFDFQRKCGKDFIACFTDSVICTANRKLKTGKGLGNLEFKEKSPLLMIGAGVYETAGETKMRGFKWHSKFSKLMRKYPRKRIYKIPQKMRVSTGIFVRRPLVTFDDFNQIYNDEKRLNLNFDSKRIWERPFRNGRDALHSQIGSKPKSLDIEM